MGDRVRMEHWGSLGGCWVEFWSPSRLTAEGDASRAHHTELGVWLQLISMVNELSLFQLNIIAV